MQCQFTVQLETRPAALAELLEALATRGIDLRSIALTSIDGQSAAVFTTNNDVVTHDVLVDGGWKFFEGEVVITSVLDEPGALADLASRLARAEIVMHGIVVLRWHQGKAELALSVDDPAAAYDALAIGSFNATDGLQIPLPASYVAERQPASSRR